MTNNYLSAEADLSLIERAQIMFAGWPAWTVERMIADLQHEIGKPRCRPDAAAHLRVLLATVETLRKESLS